MDRRRAVGKKLMRIGDETVGAGRRGKRAMGAKHVEGVRGIKLLEMIGGVQ